MPPAPGYGSAVTAAAAKPPDALWVVLPDGGQGAGGGAACDAVLNVVAALRDRRQVDVLRGMQVRGRNFYSTRSNPRTNLHSTRGVWDIRGCLSGLIPRMMCRVAVLFNSH